MKCIVKGCGEPATDHVSITLPNTAIENYDLVGPVKVPMCDGHMRVVVGVPSFRDTEGYAHMEGIS